MCFKYPFTKWRCGKCPECLSQRRTEWSLRLRLHYQYGNEIPFYFTLTYNDEHLPFSPLGYPSLRKRDIDLFLKRLRHEFKENKLKYYLCGEYGTKTMRPHYHSVIFGIPSYLSSDKVTSILQKAWNLGFVLDGSTWLKSEAQINYCTKYLINYFDLDFKDRELPFNFKSNGIGRPFVDWAIKNNYYHREIQDLFEQGKHFTIHRLEEKYLPNGIFKCEEPYLYDENLDIVWNPLIIEFDDRVPLLNDDGTTKKFTMPDYFKDKLFTKDFRVVLAAYHDYKALHKELDYYNIYSDYDHDNKVPYWLEEKRRKWNFLIRIQQDKLKRKMKSRYQIL